MARHDTQRTTVLVADDHPLYREAVVRAVRARPEFELVGETGDGREALDAIRSDPPDVAVLDVDVQSYRDFEGEAAQMTADSTAKEVEALGRRALPLRADVTQAAQVSHLFEEAMPGASARRVVSSERRSARNRRSRRITSPRPGRA